MKRCRFSVQRMVDGQDWDGRISVQAEVVKGNLPWEREVCSEGRGGGESRWSGNQDLFGHREVPKMINENGRGRKDLQGKSACPAGDNSLPFF